MMFKIWPLFVSAAFSLVVLTLNQSTTHAVIFAVPLTCKSVSFLYPLLRMTLQPRVFSFHPTQCICKLLFQNSLHLIYYENKKNTILLLGLERCTGASKSLRMFRATLHVVKTWRPPRGSRPPSWPFLTPPPALAPAAVLSHCIRVVMYDQQPTAHGGVMACQPFLNLGYAQAAASILGSLPLFHH